MKRIAVFISGRGSNMRAVLSACKKGIIDGKIVLVISDRDAPGLKTAEAEGIPSLITTENDIIEKSLDHVQADIILLAGYLKKISPDIIRKYKGRIINIHPSLIPAFCGAGFYGDRVHRAVFDKGVHYTGATTHFVTENFDEGPIILQKAVEITPEDTPESIAEKVLKEEHPLLVETMKLCCEDRAVLVDGRVMII